MMAQNPPPPPPPPPTSPPPATITTRKRSGILPQQNSSLFVMSSSLLVVAVFLVLFPVSALSPHKSSTEVIPNAWIESEATEHQHYFGDQQSLGIVNDTERDENQKLEHRTIRTRIENKRMNLLYERYLEMIAKKYGENWEENYELVVDKEEVYERYLAFRERVSDEEGEHLPLIEEKEAFDSPKNVGYEANILWDSENFSVSYVPKHDSFYLDHEWGGVYRNTNAQNLPDKEVSTYSDHSQVERIHPERDLIDFKRPIRLVHTREASDSISSIYVYYQ